MAYYSTRFAQQNTQKRELPGDLRRLLPYHMGRDYRVVGDDIVLIETVWGRGYVLRDPADEPDRGEEDHKQVANF